MKSDYNLNQGFKNRQHQHAHVAGTFLQTSRIAVDVD